MHYSPSQFEGHYHAITFYFINRLNQFHIGTYAISKAGKRV
jgi:hypothetical protein